MAKVEIFKLGLDGTQYLSVAQKIQKQIVKLTKQQKILAKTTEGKVSKAFVSNSADLKQLRSEHQDVQKAIIGHNNQQKKTIDLTEAVNDEMERNVVTINEANQQTTRLNKIKKDLNVQIENGIALNQEEFDLSVKINKQTDSNTKFVKENSSATEQQFMNIGNYASALDGLSPKLSGLIGGLKKMRSGLKSQTKGLSGSKKGFKQFNLVLKASIIGIIVGLVVFLATQFSKLQPVMDKVSQVFAGLNAVMDATIGFFMDIISLIGDVASGQKSLTEAWDEGAESLSNLGGKMRDAYNEGVAIEKLIQANRTLARSTSLLIGRLEIQAERQKAISDDSTRSFKERETALKKSINLEQAIANERLVLAKRELEAVTRTNNALVKSGKFNEEAKNNQADAVIALIDAEKEIQSIRLSNLKELNMLNQDKLEKDLDILIDGFDNTKKLNDKIIDNDKTTLEERARLIKETSRLGEESFNKQIETLQKLTDKNININELLKESNDTLLNEKIRSLELSEIGETRLLEVIKERRIVEAETSEQTKELANDRINKFIEDAERELKIFKDTNKSKIQDDKFLNEEIFNNETTRLENELIQDKLFLDKKLEQGVLSQQEFDDAVKEVKENSRLKQEELTKQREEAKKEQDIANLELQREIDEETFNDRFQLESDRLESQRLRDVTEAEKSGADINLINKKYANFQKNLDKEKQQAIRQGYADTFGQVANILGENSALGKAFAIAEATTQGIIGVQNAYTTAQKSPITIANPSYPFIQAGIAGAFSGAQIAKIAGVKFEKGGLQEIGGKRHSEGGTKFVGEDGTAFEAERGELIGVMSRQASEKFIAFNNMYTDGNGGNGVFQNGGAISLPSSIKNVTRDDTSVKFAQILSEQINSIKVVNNVNDTAELIQDNIEVQNLANI